MKIAYLCCVAALLAAALSIDFQLPTHAQNPAKIKRAENPISNRYIVVLADENPDLVADVGDIANDLTGDYPGTLGQVYRAALRGYSVEMLPQDAEKLSADPRVKFVEEDSEVEPQTVQRGATWGISRIDNHNPYHYPLDTNYMYQTTGQGVNAYVIDTGVNITHPDFHGRAFEAANVSGDPTPIDQCSPHGTHVAGTIGSTTYGVAKNVNLYSVRVFPCFGGTAVSNVVAGVDWVSANAVRPAVANLSSSGGISASLDQAIVASIGRGITYVVAAGNYNHDACLESPAHIPEVITVAMADQMDQRADISNYGECVDLFAPGATIVSTGNMPNYPYEYVMGGTSTAAPHVAGVAALYLEANPGASPQQVRDAIVSHATPNILSDVGPGSPNLLLFSLNTRNTRLALLGDR